MKKCSLPDFAFTVDPDEVNTGEECSDLEALELRRIKESYKYPIRLMQKFIVDFFKVLKREKHYIYAFLGRTK